jgi:glycosyltransferase involved in cell wall biosynthesis
LKVLLVQNISWGLYNFRADLMRELQSHGVEVVACATYDDYSHRIENMGIRYIEIPMKRKGLNPIIDFWLFIRLYRLYIREKPDVIFHNTIKPIIFGSLAARFANNKKVVNMISGLGYVFIGDGILHRSLKPFVKWLFRHALKSCKKVLFQNPDDRKYFIDQRIVSEQITEITYGSGVNTERFHYVESSNKKDNNVFIYIGRILKDKGIIEFIEAAKKVKVLYPDTKFQLLGMIDQNNPTNIDKKTIDGWVKIGLVEYLGEVLDVRSFIEQSDVVVLPSYREGVPKSLLEAMAMGKPIITTDVPGCRETIDKNKNGLLIPPRDIYALCQAMQYMILNPERRKEMGREGRKLAVEKFDVRKVNTMILQAMGVD